MQSSAPIFIYFSGNDALWNEYFTQKIFVYVKFRKLHSMEPHALILIHFWLIYTEFYSTKQTRLTCITNAQPKSWSRFCFRRDLLQIIQTFGHFSIAIWGSASQTGVCFLCTPWVSLRSAPGPPKQTRGRTWADRESRPGFGLGSLSVRFDMIGNLLFIFRWIFCCLCKLSVSPNAQISEDLLHYLKATGFIQTCSHSALQYNNRENWQVSKSLPYEVQINNLIFLGF